MTDQKTVIVTRHQGLVEWLSRKGITGDVIPSATVDDVRGKRVVGALPLYLAAEAESVVAVEYICPFEFRGKDLSADQLEELGAKLSEFRVERITS